MKTRHNKNFEPFKCEQCEKTFTTKNSLLVHTKSVHEGVRHNCEQCDKIYKSREVLNWHVQTVHNNMVFTFKCKTENCDKIYKNKGTLNEHIRRDHKNGTLSVSLAK